MNNLTLRVELDRNLNITRTQTSSLTQLDASGIVDQVARAMRSALLWPGDKGEVVVFQDLRET